MTKSQLTQAIGRKLKPLTKADLELCVDTVFATMADALCRDERVEIRGFGSFSVRHRDARNGRNPKTGEIVQVQAKSMPFFQAGKELKERVNRGRNI